MSGKLRKKTLTHRKKILFSKKGKILEIFKIENKPLRRGQQKFAQHWSGQQLSKFKDSFKTSQK